MEEIETTNPIVINKVSTGEVIPSIKRYKDHRGLPLVPISDSPLLDSQAFEDRRIEIVREVLEANLVSENVHEQVEVDLFSEKLFQDIVGTRTDGTQWDTQCTDDMINGPGKTNPRTTRGWEVCILWCEGSTTWHTLKYVKLCYPVQLAEYARQNHLQDEPAFRWWIRPTLRIRDRMISKVKRGPRILGSKYLRVSLMPYSWIGIIKIMHGRKP